METTRVSVTRFRLQCLIVNDNDNCVTKMISDNREIIASILCSQVFCARQRYADGSPGGSTRRRCLPVCWTGWRQLGTDLRRPAYHCQ